MILKPLDQITEADLNDLVTNAVSEQKTLDYKQQLPDPNDAGKRELLADVSSFANTAGGDLIFGMTESAGVPSGMPEYRSPIPTRRSCDSIVLFEPAWHREFDILQGLFPRECRHVLIIRSERSWYGPHRVVFKAIADSGGVRRTGNTSLTLRICETRSSSPTR